MTYIEYLLTIYVSLHFIFLYTNFMTFKIVKENKPLIKDRDIWISVAEQYKNEVMYLRQQIREQKV